jgi:hypothetical protein
MRLLPPRRLRLLPFVWRPEREGQRRGGGAGAGIDAPGWIASVGGSAVASPSIAAKRRSVASCKLPSWLSSTAERASASRPGKISPSWPRAAANAAPRVSMGGCWRGAGVGAGVSGATDGDAEAASGVGACADVAASTLPRGGTPPIAWIGLGGRNIGGQTIELLSRLRPLLLQGSRRQRQLSPPFAWVALRVPRRRHRTRQPRHLGMAVTGGAVTGRWHSETCIARCRF